MPLFGIAKDNLLAQFKARFDPDPNGNGYIFYPDVHADGYKCSEQQYQAFVNAFRDRIKSGTRILWLSLLLIIPVMIYIEIQIAYEVQFWEFSLFLLPPLFLVMYRGYQSFTAPNRFFENQRFSSGMERVRVSKVGNKQRQRGFETRIKGMSWSFLIFAFVISILGLVKSFFFGTDLSETTLVMYLALFSGLLAVSIYLIWKKFTIHTKENNW